MAISSLVNSLKGVSARRLRAARLPEVERKLWGPHFWSPSYCAVSCGVAPLETVKRYVEAQRGVAPSRPEGRGFRDGDPMKRRREKANMRRMMRDVRRAELREMGDHRRWCWMVAPWREECAILGPCTVHFDARWGRLYTPERQCREVPGTT